MDQILKILEEDALASPEKIAAMLGLDAEAVRAHIRLLEEQKVILAYKALVDDEKANRELVRAVIEVRITPERGGGFDRLAERIAKFDEVQDCHLMSGGYDLLVVVEGSDLKAVARFVAEKLSTISGVLSTATHFTLKAYKEQGTLFRIDQQEERLSISP